MKNLQNPKDREEIIRRLRNVKWDTQRRWGKMCPNQMICHLSDAFRAAMGEKTVAPTGNLFQRVVVKRMLMYLPPITVKNYPTAPEINQEIGGTRPTTFARDVVELERLIHRFTDEEIDVSKWSHPFFGQMTRWEWSRWAYIHCSHHLRQFNV